jgi:hypothetical protein
MGILSKIKSITPTETKTICVVLPAEEVVKFDALCRTYHLNRSRLVALAMKTLREQVEAEKEPVAA